MDTPADQSIEKAIERRRSAETARKARIFNTRHRVIGLDLDGLNQQFQEKKNLQYREQQRDNAFDKMTQYSNEMLLLQDSNERDRRAALNCDLTQYWATQQRVEDSRDADLKCDQKGAFRITLSENELGPASMQIFQGEEIGEEQKRRDQMRETKRTLNAQKEDNERRHMGEKHREMLMANQQMQQDFWGVHQHALEEESMRATRIATSNYNQALATEQAERAKEQHRREERENLAEMMHTLTSDMMTETAGGELGGGRPPRVQVDRWKGMSPEQLSAIHREREEQRFDKQRRRDAEKVQKAVWHLQLLKQGVEVEGAEKREAELRREKRIETDQYNMQLARDQQANQEYLNKRLYTNKPTKEYFHQFNTSSR